MAIDILRRDDLPLGGFAGLKEHRLVMSPDLFGQYVNPGTWPGIGGFVYLADARFDPRGETTMHDHREIDVISVMVEGRVQHHGSLEHGRSLVAGDVQVQRAGAEGFSHNEINPDDTRNRMLQLWVVPEREGESAAYELYKTPAGETTRVYGGNHDQNKTLPSRTVIDIASLNPSQEFALETPYLAYLAAGEGTAGDAELDEGDLFKGDGLGFRARSQAKLIVIHEI